MPSAYGVSDSIVPCTYRYPSKKEEKQLRPLHSAYLVYRTPKILCSVFYADLINGLESCTTRIDSILKMRTMVDFFTSDLSRPLNWGYPTVMGIGFGWKFWSSTRSTDHHFSKKKIKLKSKTKDFGLICSKYFGFVFSHLLLASLSLNLSRSHLFLTVLRSLSNVLNGCFSKLIIMCIVCNYDTSHWNTLLSLDLSLERTLCVKFYDKNET